MPKLAPVLSSSQPDPILLDELALAQRFALAFAALIGLVVLAAWLIPPFSHILPVEWSVMKANTALVVLLSVCALTLSQPKRSEVQLKLSRAAAIVVVGITFTTLVEYATGRSFGLDTVLAADRLSVLPGRMSPQSATAFLLLGVVTGLIRARKRLMAHVADLFIFCLSLQTLIMVSAYVFGAMHLVGPTLHTRTAPQTVVSLSMLSFVAFGRRAEYGVFGILVGIGIGSKIARIASPFALFLPFVLETSKSSLIRANSLTAEYATALATSLAAMLAFGLVMVLAWRIDGLEKEIRDLSLRDGLTELYNRRGFYVLAEQALRLAERARAPFSVLYLDLDNLKKINDSLGHDTGSEFLCEVSAMLEEIFSGTEIVGRIGGDEFVVAGDFSVTEMQLAVQRLQQAAIERNALPERLYPVDFSLGHVTTEVGQSEPLEALLGRADRVMYAAKQRRKQARKHGEEPEQPLMGSDVAVAGTLT